MIVDLIENRECDSFLVARGNDVPRRVGKRPSTLRNFVEEQVAGERKRLCGVLHNPFMGWCSSICRACTEEEKDSNQYCITLLMSIKAHIEETGVCLFIGIVRNYSNSSNIILSKCGILIKYRIYLRKRIEKTDF